MKTAAPRSIARSPSRKHAMHPRDAFIALSVPFSFLAMVGLLELFPEPRSAAGLAAQVAVAVGVPLAVALWVHGFRRLFGAAPAYEQAIARLASDARWAAEIGEVEKPIPPLGSLRTLTHPGTVSMSFTVHGSRRSASVDVDAVRDGSGWTLTRMDVTPY